MQNVLKLLADILASSWAVLLDASPFVLIGLLVAALLKALVPDEFVSTHFGGNSFLSIVKASAFGVPIPLCSCGVVPAAAGLRRQGAGKGPVASFLISTPETGVDSIAVSWALLDPIMTVARPVAGFLTAIAAGVAVATGERIRKHEGAQPVPEATPPCTSSCCCGHDHHDEQPKGIGGRLKQGLGFAFGDLLKDVGGWLLFGILISGAISVLLPQEAVERYLGNDLLVMLLMLLVSIPLYVCATASTPIAAAFALKGISPGAALVFLLAGPATNAASITVVSRLLGKRATAAYLAAIVVMSLLAGFAVNHLYALLGLDLRHWIAAAGHEEHGPFAIASAAVLVLLVVKSYLPALKPSESE
jgi:uncharacterized membrane protein YraQ (UPF0718 family)